MKIPPRLKVCCISSVDEARLAVELGASALGLVSKMPSGPGVISDELIGEISASVPPPVSTFLLTSQMKADAIVEQHRICRTSTIQLVDSLDVTELVKLRSYLPLVKLVQVIHVTGEQSVIEAKQRAGYVDALLLDSGNPELAIKELGGTGRVHNWKISRVIRDSVRIPIFLAGGLNSDNVAEAVRAVRPFGVDLCTSIRSNGMLDAERLSHFVKELATL
ncbi:MAG: phosphoribosylanthranilate isomerase [Pirellula sp.]|jgi:phosphoribosylanthranilate isomerase|nr:phosphoribosylanthranilate isomerase [Pirellula sp.]